MPPNRSYRSSSWVVPHKPRAMGPRTIQDYNLLAATVACWGMPSDMISRQFGFEEDYAEQLLRSGPGRAFTEWLWRQPEDFVKQHQVSVDSHPEPGTETEEIPSPDPDPPTLPSGAEEALAKIFSNSAEDE
jgi:hypothetical protein